MKNTFLKIIVLTLTLASLGTCAKLDLPNPVTIVMDYEVSEYTIGETKHAFPHFTIRSNLTFTEPTGVTQNVNFVPELTLDYTLTVDKSITGDVEAEKWGIECLGQEKDDCTPGTEEQQSTVAYQGTDYSFMKDTTVMCFLDKFEIGQGKLAYNIRRVTKFKNEQTGPWKSGKTGVMGFGMKSDLVDYIYEQYNVTPDEQYLNAKDYAFGVAIRLNNLKEDDKWTGSKAGTFDGSFITINGYTEKDINKDEGIKWAKSDTNNWAMNTATSSLKIDGKDDLKIAEGKHCLDFNSPGAIILPKNSPKILQINNAVNQALCQKNNCDDTTDISTGPSLTLTFLQATTGGDNYTFTVQPQDYIYHDKESKKTVVSISSMEDSITNGRCSQTDQIGLGRMFFLNRYVMFKRSTVEDESNVEYTWSIGISDKVAEDDLSGLWLVYTVSFSILGAMILLFILKTICLWNRDDKMGQEDEAIQVEGDNYAQAE